MYDLCNAVNVFQSGVSRLFEFLSVHRAAAGVCSHFVHINTSTNSTAVMFVRV